MVWASKDEANGSLNCSQHGESFSVEKVRKTYKQVWYKVYFGS